MAGMDARRRMHLYTTAGLLVAARDHLRRYQDDDGAAELARQCDDAAQECCLHAFPLGGVIFAEVEDTISRMGVDMCLRVAIAGDLQVDDATLVAMASAYRDHSILLARIAGDDSGEPFPFDAHPAAALDVAERCEHVVDGLRCAVEKLAEARS